MRSARTSKANVFNIIGYGTIAGKRPAGQIAAGAIASFDSNWEEKSMRTASIAASLLLAVCITTAGFSTPSRAASDNPVSGTAPAILKKKTLAQPLKPTWDQCFEMSITRGFNHDTEEWHQSIEECMAGKIPL